VFAAWLFVFISFLAIWREAGWPARALEAIVLALLGMEILLSIVPPTARDELTHHLALPRLYARAGRIIDLPIAPYSYYPMLLDMLYTPWVYWGYDFVPKLIHLLFGSLTGLLIFAYLARRMNVVYGLLGLLLFVSVPAVFRLSHWAYVDLGVTFFSTAALICLLRWRESDGAIPWLLCAGLTAGFAAATKPNGFVVVVMLSFIVAFTLAAAHRNSAVTVAGRLIVFGAMAAAPVLPWLVKNWLSTGNPFFPFLASWFTGSSDGAALAPASFTGLGILAKRELLYGESWWEIAALPVRLFFSGRDDSPQYFDGVLSPSLVVLLPWAFKGKWRDEKRVWLSFSVLYLAYALFLVDLRVRYVLPIVPPLVVLAVYGIFNIYLNIRRPALLAAGLAVVAALHASHLWRYYADVRPLDYLTGQEGREDYLRRMLPEYPAFDYVNRELPAAAKVYLLFVGRRAYYCERDYFHDGGELPALLVSAIRSAADPKQIGKALEGRGITHLVVREDLFQTFLADNLRPAEQALWNDFAGTHLRAQFRDRGYGVYQLYG
jgi:hypothetical protein